MTSHPSPSPAGTSAAGSRVGQTRPALLLLDAGRWDSESGCKGEWDSESGCKGGARHILPGQAGGGGGPRGSALAGLRSPHPRDTRSCSCRASPGGAGSTPGMPAWLGCGGTPPSSSSSSQGRPALPVHSGSGKLGSRSSGFGGPESRPRGCKNPPLVPQPRLGPPRLYDFVSPLPSLGPSPVLPPPLPPVALGDRFNFLSPLGFFRTNQTNCDKMLVISGKTIKFLRLHLR